MMMGVGANEQLVLRFLLDLRLSRQRNAAMMHKRSELVPALLCARSRIAVSIALRCVAYRMRKLSRGLICAGQYRWRCRREY